MWLISIFHRDSLLPFIVYFNNRVWALELGLLGKPCFSFGKYLFIVVSMYGASSYVCCECGEKFDPTFWNWVTSVKNRFKAARRVTCPKCKKGTGASMPHL
jgi:DNA-directed RNA polymerase subunit RPC12/RpoP